MLSKLSRGLLLGSLAVLAACGAARVIHQDQMGGVIELQGDQGQAMQQANQQMAAHCGANNFTVVSQGEEAIGTDTVTQQTQSTDSSTSRSGRQSSTDTPAPTQQPGRRSPRRAPARTAAAPALSAAAPERLVASRPPRNRDAPPASVCAFHGELRWRGRRRSARLQLERLVLEELLEAVRAGLASVT